MCGLELADPPWGVDGRSPLFDYCPCCGVEFGYADATPAAARAFRAKWQTAGAQWSEPEARPCNWDLEEQLSDIPQEFR